MATQTALKIPTDYQKGYEKARLADPELASNYVAHTLVGDPSCETMVRDLSEFTHEEQGRLLIAAMNRKGEASLRSAPASLRDFFEEASTVPDWVDIDEFMPGIRMFHRNSKLVLAAFVTGVLVEGFTTNIAKSFFITGRVRDSGVRRLQNNNRHMVDIFLPGGLDRYGDGWKLFVRIRVIHSRVRRLLSQSDEWDLDSWGLPVSAAHLGYAIAAFSARLLLHMKTLGARYTDEEYASFMAVWRYAGWLMGVPETILFRDGAEALELYDIGLMCEPRSEMESVVMAHSLINSAPVVAGITDHEERRALAKYLYRFTRGLIGKELADSLDFPQGSSIGVVAHFRATGIFDRIMDKLFPKRASKSSFNRFSGLLETSVLDEGGISYRLPDHVYAEQSSRW